jgi:hypothetical protein
VPNLVVPGHVVLEVRGVRFSGFPFEWDMAYNNLPCTNVQAVILAYKDFQNCVAYLMPLIVWKLQNKLMQLGIMIYMLNNRRNSAPAQFASVN